MADTEATPVKNGASDEAEQRGKALVFRKALHQKVLESIGIGRTLGRQELSQIVESTVNKILESMEIPSYVGLDRDALFKETIESILGFGPIEDLLRDPTINDIMINGYDKIYVERSGKLEQSPKSFLDNAHLRNIIDRILRNLGKSVNDLNPYVDGRLEDGSRINVVIPPLALEGPLVTIRKFPARPLTSTDLIERFNSLTAPAVDFFRIAVRNRKNVLISGGAGSGKTTLLNVLSAFIPETERIVTIEDSAELRLSQPHVARMETRMPNYEGKGLITIRDLVRNALRMRPDRIVVGECRGSEAIDMLQAMNTGHDGSLTTIHANSPQEVLMRLETMVTLGGFDIPIWAIRRQIASSIHIVIHVARLADGSRKVMKVSEVTGIKDGEIAIQDLFEFHKEHVSRDGRIRGTLRTTGNMPTFYKDFMDEEKEALERIFRPGNGEAVA